MRPDLSLHGPGIRPTSSGVKAIAVALLFSCACSSVTWHRAKVATLAIAEASITCDWGQTSGIEDTGWRLNYESNPMLGTHPNQGAITTYFAAVGLGLLAASVLLPEKVSPFVFGAVVAVEAKTLYTNATQRLASTHMCRR